ncbi:sodium/calcium exchanger protein [Cellulomonas sp. ATA003]|uniref:sodium/calcium exchanger protein n=1 Tax=Cellulomonas sp. ATA003 TaxID=3073064 RepID=UPI0028734361|nr:sodium/calcium exchanger protein [Cellulomonas sp. ATA003]WNB87539.1 sodium/calcium exchanger protein [Cellulomonas sp. ATA003]
MQPHRPNSLPEPDNRASTEPGANHALALGAYFLVTGTRQVGNALGLQPIVSGLFITAFMTALPQVFTTWSVVRTGQVTSGVTSVFADHTMTFTLAVVPLAIVGVQIRDYLLVVVVMAFVALMPLLFSVLALRRRRDDQQALHLSDVLMLGAAVLVYVGTTAFLLFGRG